jgi:hypothetical protein
MQGLPSNPQLSTEVGGRVQETTFRDVPGTAMNCAPFMRRILAAANKG